MEGLDKRVVLITGASRGIGKEIAISMAKKAAKVVINYTSNHDAALETLKEAKKYSTDCMIAQFDVSSEEQILKAYDEIKAALGSVGILINNAGITSDGLLLRLKESDLDRQININLKGAILCSKIFIKDMLKNKFGRIINVTSVSGQSGNAGQCVYSATKAGLIGFTKSLALEVGRKNITVNALSPGYIETDMTKSILERSKEEIVKQIPLDRIGSAQDIADAAMFLASSHASYITGQVLSVNGGLYI